MFTEDWLDLGLKDEQDSHLYMLSGRLDALLPNRISYEYDLRGPRYDDP
jgi:acyl transferase domain-containing protein